MSTRAAVIESLERPPIVRIAERRPRPEQLIERQGAVEDVAAGQAEDLLQVKRAQRRAAEDARLEAGRITLDRIDHQIRDLLAAVVPGAAIGQLRRHMLTEQ